MRNFSLLVFPFVTFFLSMTLQVHAADGKEKVKDNEKKESVKTFSEAEHQKILKDEIEKMVKKISGSNMAEFAKELLGREEALEVKDLELKKREGELKVNMSDFEKKVKEFQEMQKKFISCIDDQNQKENKRVSQMVEVIQGMRPQSASDLLSVQDTEIAVKILAQLDPLKVSKIFNLMDKEISAKLQKQFMTMKK